MKKRKASRQLVAGFLVVCFLLGLRFFAVAEPDSAIGFALFRCSYALSSSKAVALRGFDANLVAYKGGYIPDRIDKFFESRLQTTNSPQEFDAIVDFYAFKAGGREGQRVFIWPARLKEKATASIISRLNNYSADQAASALILVEDMRQGQDNDLFKSHLFSDDKGTQSGLKYSTWLQQKGVPQAKILYRKWWNSHTTWEEKVKHDPLANSHLHIEGI